MHDIEEVQSVTPFPIGETNHMLTNLGPGLATCSDKSLKSISASPATLITSLTKPLGS